MRRYIVPVLLLLPLFVHAQSSGADGQNPAGPRSYPGAPHLTSEEIRVIADILSAGNGNISFADGGNGQALLLSEIAADPNAAGMSSDQISDISAALARYAQLQGASTKTPGVSPEQGNWTIPVSAPVYVTRGFTSGEASSTVIGPSGNPAVVAAELLGLALALAAFGIAARFRRPART